MALQMTNIVYFCVKILQLYQSLIKLQSDLKMNVFFIETKEGYVHFLIILIWIHGTSLLVAHLVFLRNHSSTEMTQNINFSFLLVW
jgi:hypothetical protein